MAKDMSDRVYADIRRGHLRVAVLWDGTLADLYLLSLDDPAPAGRIFIARVGRVLPGLNGAFVDLGTGSDGFLRATAARHAHLFDGSGRPAADWDPDERPRIGDFVTEGQRIAVQVSRPSADGKGPTVTTELTVAGRYAVLRAGAPTLSISRRISDDAERQDLGDALTPLLDGDTGFIVRTAAINVDPAAVVAEAEALRDQWSSIRTQLEEGAPPMPVEDEATPLLRILREIEVEEGVEIKTQGLDGVSSVQRHIDRYWPDLAGAIEADAAPEELFERAGINEALAEFEDSRVDLDGGGVVWIEPTRALTAIDVDTAGRSGGGGPGNPIVETNLAAAEEIARQLRVRNIAGPIVVDFVHMRRRQDREAVMASLREACGEDRVPIQVLGLSPLGLVEMTRDRNAFSTLDAFLHRDDDG